MDATEPRPTDLPDLSRQDDLAGTVRRAAAGDRAAFGLLVEAEWDRLVRLARSVVGDTDAEDVVQDALLGSWRALPGLRRPDAFSTWISRVVLRRCFRRNRRHRPDVALDTVQEPEVRPSVDAGLDVERLLALLAPRQRAVLHLTAVEGRTDREIGTMLGITAGSVRAHRRRARTTLARRLAGDGGTGTLNAAEPGRTTPDEVAP